jgi:hypothetical protein
MSPATQAGIVANLIAGLRTALIVQQTAGITSGPGNNGSACEANVTGHAGTSATVSGIPASLRFGEVS